MATDTSVINTTIGVVSTRPPPDGGLQAWLVVLGAWCSMFCSFGVVQSSGVFQAYYEKYLLSSYTPSTISWISSLQPFMVYLGGPFVGRYFDKHGPRLLVLSGSFLTVLGIMLSSLSTAYWHLLLTQGICYSLGACLIVNASLAAVATYFDLHAAFAIGFATSGAAIGGIVLPILMERLLAIVGFAWTMRVLGFLLLGITAITNVTVKSWLPPRPEIPSVGFKDYLLPFTEAPFLLVAFGALMGNWGQYIPPNFIVVQAQAEGMSSQLSAYLPTVMSVGSLFGRILLSYVSDRLGRFNIMAASCIFTAIISLALWIPAHGNILFAFAVLYGFGTGGFNAIGLPIIAQISDAREFGLRQGAAFALAGIGSLAGSPIGGALRNGERGGFFDAQVFAGGLWVLAAAFFMAARVMERGWGLRTKV